MCGAGFRDYRAFTGHKTSEITDRLQRGSRAVRRAAIPLDASGLREYRDADQHFPVWLMHPLQGITGQAIGRIPQPNQA